MKEKLHIVEQLYSITRHDRELANGHKAACVWFTGLSGSGKSTIANVVEQELYSKGIRTYTLDGDNIRKGLNKGLTFTDEDRSENLRRIGEVAKLMCDTGLVLLATFITPLERQRQSLRELLGDMFIEVFVDTPIEICEQRDVKGLYKKARAGEISNFTGISSPFEHPVSPELYIDTTNQTLEQCVNLVLEGVLPRIKSAN
ncbi:adenylyl-sulfate kinase [Mucilaginibacter gotjawali]|uniref:Adenylyl-sulfate kinase n=2 Tax=Mucilaginibacter gotjawali TaxID=1550579 RepID=A0A110B0A7_9SPHI|nr:adenylyl-sulfate kinase [Mucilaginibacter gotjawali]MBB3057476.1 adenylylsulfate kinase [Mucilaginibacter gotjawali]BAU55405.1 Adenylyl-sulfate kinase [Mucilaginibacter gotjawali]